MVIPRNTIIQHIGFFVVCIALFASAVTCRAEPEPFIKDVTVEEAKALLSAKDKNITVIDVRTPREFEQGHIPKAKMINFKAPDFKENLSKLDRNKPYLVHCKSGGRSARAIKVWKELGFTKVYHMSSGWLGWKKAEKPE